MVFEQKGAEPMDAVVNMRCTSAEKAALKQDADLAALSVSEYIRRRALGRPVVAHVDAAAIRELRRLGGLMKHLHNDSGGAYSSETAAVLLEIKQAIERLA